MVQAPIGSGDSGPSGSALASPEVRALFGFLLKVAAIPSVRKVTVGPSDIWIWLAEDDLEDSEKILALEYELRRAVPLNVNIHLVPTGQVDEANMPPADLLYQR